MSEENDEMQEATVTPVGEPAAVTGDAEQVDAEQGQAVAPDGLGLADLNLMANVIEVVGQRGAIRANEMAEVGVLYNKLSAFLIHHGARPQPGVEPVEHTHEDGTTHAHEGGNVDHTHAEQGESNA